MELREELRKSILSKLKENKQYGDHQTQTEFSAQTESP